MNTSGKVFHPYILGSLLLLALLSGAIGCQQDTIFSDSTKPRQEGVRLYNERAYADAAGSFKNAIRQDPRDYMSRYYLGASYEQLKQYQQAIQAYKASLDAQGRTLAGQEDEAQRIRTVSSLASAIAKSDERDSETNVIEQKAKAEQRSGDYYLLAKIYQYRGDMDSALDAFNRAALLNPKDFEIQKEYGLLLEQLGQKDRATQPLRKAYALNEKDAQVNEALRRVGVVPGPGLKEEKDLTAPPVPRGPLPEVDLSNFKMGAKPAAPPEQLPAATPSGSGSAPKD